MDEPLIGFSQGVIDDFLVQGNSQDHSPQFGQYLHPQAIHGVESATSGVHDQVVSLGNETVENQTANLIAPGSIDFPESGFANFSITRQEVLVLSNVLGRIPQTFITGGEGELGQTMALTVIDDTNPTVIATTSSQEEMLAHSSSGTTRQQTEHDPPEVRGKRRRPKYSLTGSMFKRHPIMKFSVTGPLDRDRSPYKWWCRVCRVELSLMSRGSLELISHYRSDSHLIREHRIRMEVPGMPLYDKDERELLGIAVQEAKKKAKEVYPIPLQLDSYRPLVGQESVPDFSVSTSPAEKIYAQINILEFGLRYGGNIASLTGMYDELVRLTSSDRLSVQNWSQERLFVSFSIFFL